MPSHGDAGLEETYSTRKIITRAYTEFSSLLYFFRTQSHILSANLPALFYFEQGIKLIFSSLNELLVREANAFQIQ